MTHPLAAQVLAALPPQLKAALDGTGLQPEAAVAVLFFATLLLGVLLLKLLFGSGSKASKSRTVAIVGPSGAGKTQLFFQIQGVKHGLGTVASMVENEGSCQLRDEAGRPGGAAVRVVDVPGHERLRHKLEGHLNDARAVVFVLDSVDITPHRVEAAEELFEVLTCPALLRRRTPVLLACNKMDQEEQAHSLEFIRRTLEKQLDAMRRTRGALSPEAAQRAAALGKVDKPFSLAALRMPVTFAPVSALAGDVGAVHAFLRAAMR